ncbi:MAG: hypothetical protein AAGF47_02015 [Planctomycetota bacterium]
MTRLHRPIPIVFFLALLGASAALTGCRTVWEDSYRPVVGAPPLPGTAAVVVREVPWERMDRAIEDSNARVAASDVHPSEWSDEEKIEARAELLTSLQIAADPAATRVLGVSSFRTTNRIRPWDGSLAAFAREVGANHVAWSDRYLGKAEAIVDRTVYIDSFGYGRRGFRSRRTTVTEPVVIKKDERGYTAFFLHIEP